MDWLQATARYALSRTRKHPTRPPLVGTSPPLSYNERDESHTMISAETRRQLTVDLQRDEGWRSEPYLCTAKVPTIGWGRTSGVTLDSPPTTQQAELPHFLADVEQAITDADNLFANFRGLDPVRQLVLCNMSFNLGLTRLRKFVNLIRAVENENYEAAAMHMRQSLWFKQVGTRSKYLVERMRTGRIAPEHIARGES